MNTFDHPTVIDPSEHAVWRADKMGKTSCR